MRTYDNGGVDNEWFNAANWSPAGLPASDDELTVDSGTPSTTTLVEVNDLGAVLVTGSGVSATFNELRVGAQGEASLTIDEGAIANAGIVRMGQAAESLGFVTVDGPGSQLATTAGVSVGFGNEAIGFLGVSNQAVVSSPSFFSVGGVAGSSGDVFAEEGTITSSGFVDVGSRGIGFMELTFGSSLTSTNTLRIGDFSTGEGTVLVNDSTIDVKSLTVGARGYGVLEISNGSVVTGTGTSGGDVLRMGDVLGSLGEVYVEGAGTLLDLATQGAQIGNRGAGELEVLDGAEFRSKSGSLGTFGSGSQGYAIVLGSGSQWNMTSTLEVGREGSGQLEIIDGGIVTFSSGQVGSQATGKGVVFISGPGSELVQTDPNGILAIGNSGMGRVELSNGGKLTTVSTLLEDNGTLAGSGIHVGDLQSRGRVEPGLSPGKLTVEGEYTQLSPATLAIELAGTVAESEYDILEITASAALDGDLELTLIDSFLPTASDVFTILSAGSISGSFSNGANGGSITTADGAGQFTIHYGGGSLFNPNEVVLTDFALFDVDLDNDNDVDGADFLALQRDDPALIPAWQAQYGSGSSSVSSNNVPEPSTGCLLVAALLSIAGWRRAS
ncbi:hypothetical protein [Adhaeretor mobilis]|uniref:hypothetical protein n=1 Tax=Adhaeretor mobilis TaxID=1930276 RepID=UPI001C54EC9B|nr:hypothetical protein [Adhaeretor mobilis]